MIVQFTIPDQIFNELKKDIRESNIEYNNNLAGNIKQEYSLDKFKKKYEEFIIKQAFGNEIFLKNLKEINVLYPNDQSFTLGKLWVNFQKKYEFNPIHNHDGVFNFILFIQIPFFIEEELQKGPGVKSNNNLAGHLQFIEAGPKGHINAENLGVDKTWEKTGLIFRSYLNHCVYPFFSTDKERITVSGNVYFGNYNLK